jgi:hypothetical protein
MQLEHEFCQYNKDIRTNRIEYHQNEKKKRKDKVQILVHYLLLLNKSMD